MPTEVESKGDYENQKVVSLITAGDRQAVDHLFASCIPQLRRSAAWMISNPHDSEDVVQDGLLLAYRKLNQFQGRAKFSTWLNTIVINVALAKLRAKKYTVSFPIFDESPQRNPVHVEDSIVDSRLNPEEQYIAGERSQIFRRVLEQMPENYRRLICLMDIEGLKENEAAQQLGISVAALKARRFRARRWMLRNSITLREISHRERSRTKC